MENEMKTKVIWGFAKKFPKSGLSVYKQGICPVAQKFSAMQNETHYSGHAGMWYGKHGKHPACIRNMRLRPYAALGNVAALRGAQIWDVLN